jgi:hypothetical protein
MMSGGIKALAAGKHPTHTEAAPLSITCHGSRTAVREASESFTGAVRVDLSFKGAASARISVRPECAHRLALPPARPDVIVISGVGLVQRWGGPIQEISPGDGVWIPPRRQALKRRIVRQHHQAS